MVASVPIASYLDSAVSYEMAMAFFAIVNAIVFIATLLFVPSMPVEEKRHAIFHKMVYYEKTVTDLESI
ncbi:putative sugar efflux transporter [Paenibacillus macerans]|uniref:Transporter, major facilitator family domain protein n=1 Tax=Paenibacillus macerans TaxID=44252 RepID=A0A090YAV5_PAEMA|nr:transporter, major facilitator family domain protein [Paenibacillus macerans]GBK66057.1 hypothetical protein PbDSM24746_60610 [Paenibacillus macerans]GBK72395.1 hypothetical protein PbJCM17693_61030 [Paenibacillus macerans]GIP14184.1 hypothetical protein J1TS5_63540 [Paenibacillus macerans]SUD26047.1 putative sugar efflux transporter [Paenibacillus macerans]